MLIHKGFLPLTQPESYSSEAESYPSLRLRVEITNRQLAKQTMLPVVAGKRRSNF